MAPQIGALLAEFPRMPSTVIAERIGWARGKTVLFDRIAQLRPLYQPPDPVQRTGYSWHRSPLQGVLSERGKRSGVALTGLAAGRPAGRRDAR
jgi:hypothetical protein